VGPKALGHPLHLGRPVPEQAPQHLWLFSNFGAQHGIGQR
jgi:hypothetical protein